jgi:hypothetical protein
MRNLKMEGKILGEYIFGYIPTMGIDTNREVIHPSYFPLLQFRRGRGGIHHLSKMPS